MPLVPEPGQFWATAGSIYRTDKYLSAEGRTDEQMQATTIPLRPKWPRGKNDMEIVTWNMSMYMQTIDSYSICQVIFDKNKQ